MKVFLFSLFLLCSIQKFVSNKEIRFSGYDWEVLDENDPQCSNCDAKNAVVYDSELHMFIMGKEGNVYLPSKKWYTSHIRTKKKFGYGKFIFELMNNGYDENVEVKIRKYDYTAKDNAYRQMSYEIRQRDHSSNVDNFTMQFNNFVSTNSWFGHRFKAPANHYYIPETIVIDYRPYGVKFEYIPPRNNEGYHFERLEKSENSKDGSGENSFRIEEYKLSNAKVQDANKVVFRIDGPTVQPNKGNDQIEIIFKFVNNYKELSRGRTAELVIKSFKYEPY